VLPLFENLYRGIELLFIGRVFENCPMKYFRMIEDEPSMLVGDDLNVSW
jgi:hypothetical protein